MPIALLRLEEGLSSGPSGSARPLARAHTDASRPAPRARPDSGAPDPRGPGDEWASMRLAELASARGIGRALVAMELSRAEAQGHIPPAIPEGASLLAPLSEGFAAAWLALPIARRLRLLARVLSDRSAPIHDGAAPAFSHRLASMAFGSEPRAMEAFRAWEAAELRRALEARGEDGALLCEDPDDAARLIDSAKAAEGPRANRLSGIIAAATGIALSIGLGILIALKAVIPDEPLRFALWALVTALPVFPLCALAGGHPLAALGAFISAPAMAILPFLGTGMVAGFLQLKLDPPRLADALRLKEDVASLKTARKNRILRVVLAWSSASVAGSLGIALGGLLLTIF